MTIAFLIFMGLLIPFIIKPIFKLLNCLLFICLFGIGFAMQATKMSE